MAGCSRVSLKRKRESNNEFDGVGSDSDTIVVAVPPRRAVAVLVSRKRAPLKETQAKANVARRTRTKSVAGTSTTPRAPHTATTSPPTPSPSDDDVPDNCCYHCLNRGGQAAYNCRYENGQESCNLCIKEKKGRCQLPTEEEARKSAARCERCKTRGFKTCNGERPHCDTCIRHNTQEACWKARTKQAKRANLPTTNATLSAHADDSTPIKKPSKKRRKVAVDQTREAFSDDRDAIDATTITRSETLLRRSKHQDLSNDFMDLDAKPGLADAPFDGGEDSDVERVGRCGASSSLSSTKARSTDVTSVTDDDEAQIQRELHEHEKMSPSKHQTRPRRSRARVSYVEQIFDFDSDHDPDVENGDEDDNDDESDNYISSAATSEGLSDDELDLESLVGEQSSVNCEDDVLDDEEELNVVLQSNTKPVARKRQTASISTEGKGIDFDLPPIDSIEAAFDDMTAEGVKLGLADVLGKLSGHQLNVATMCSGTESPLLAFDMISKALEEAGHAPLKVHQRFAAEIEVFKQAFIERNQSPEIIFRDVREFIHPDAKTAITAYGAEEAIPSGLDILIAGFVCKDLSRLNSKQKSLKEDGESGDTWRAIYSYAQRFRPSIVLLENVRNKPELWNEVVSMWDEIGYEAAWLIRDTKRYRIPQTRERMYMIAIEREHYGNGVKKAVGIWQDLMEKLQRQCSSPYEAWLQNMLHESSDHAALGSEVDWALCKLRYDHIRSDERLGVLRPATRWSENGTVRPPDFANRAWYNSQSSRVYDAIDVAHLQAAQMGFDSMYKMRVLDVSQNVDRFKTALGILPCITPGGCDFATNRQEALSGKQLLLLQGMPMNKLLFGTETQRECQDLAGNAMTTTVIGASIISAIISGSKAFRSSSSSTSRSLVSMPRKALPAPAFVRLDSTLTKTLASDSLKQLDVTELTQDAIASARLCNCEGEIRLSRSSIQVCTDCGHTACQQCAGHPRHSYRPSFSRASRLLTPNDFIQKWRPQLPTRLHFVTFPDIRRLASGSRSSHDVMATFIDHVIQLRVEQQYFYLRDVLRQDYGWKVVYSSARVNLELQIGHELQWFLFANCPPGLSGNNPLRISFQSPLARAKVVESLLELEWEVRFPSASHHKLQVSGSSSRHSSWRNQLGLLDYRNETVPMSLQVKGQTKECKSLEGEFELLPECGTASTSLYKRSSSPALFLFLDPNPISSPEHDSFVFSQDCSRKHYNDTRMSSASLEPSWRPWQVQDQLVHDVEAAFSETWIATNMELASADPELSVNSLSSATSLEGIEGDCSRSIVVLAVRVPEQLPVDDMADYSWVLERAKRAPSLSTWHPITDSVDGCPCAPRYPKILWTVNENGVAAPQEARKSAAEFERSIKTRAPILSINAVSTEQETQIQVAFNIAALTHRARGRLLHTGPINAAWSLATDHADLPPEPFPRFCLKSNAKDPAFPPTPAIRYLRNAQPRSLSWMIRQEEGRHITVTEVEEAVLNCLGWRAEARAQADLVVRGGVLADLPSFGKTVTCIALIQSEFERYEPKVVLRNNKKYHASAEALLDTAATLIICPPHIALQWQTELENFLGKSRFEEYHVLVVQSFAQLQVLDLDDVQNSRVVIVSWGVFAEEDYISHLAYFTAMPEPSVSGRRSFDTWFGQAVKEIPGQLGVLQSADYDTFKTSTSDLLTKRLEREEFNVVLPVKVQHGSAYQSFNATQAKAKSQAKTTKARGKQTTARFDRASQQVPLLHLFRFNRVVVDEYHYLNDDKKMSNILASVSAKRIVATKRWVLSGTPALANFSDVDQIASYLGISLGRYHFGDGVRTTQADKMRRRDQTPVEDFLSQTEAMSIQWHRARHERAQEFLDLFVRQNEASLNHIACAENITPVELDIGHHAVYLELSQYLISQRMQIKKLHNKVRSDKINRLNASLSNSASAEDALLKSALSFRTPDGRSALDVLIEMRSEQRNSIQTELQNLMAGFEGLSMTAEISALYNRFKEDITNVNWLGDSDATRVARNLLIRARKAPNKSAFSELKGLAARERARPIKQRLSSLRETARDLGHLMRSERFISAIQDLLGPLAGQKEGKLFVCSCPDCDGTATISELHLITHCGHTACEKCLGMRKDIDTCVDPTCNLFVQDVNLVKVSNLGSTVEPDTDVWFGRKMQAVTQIIAAFPKGDQGVIFAPNDETVEILEDVLDSHEIAYHSLRGCRAAASAKMMEDFKTDDDADSQSRVLILNMGSESAAGANLVNANHVIFIAPLLTKTQYEYESAMAQAVARCRRYGQKKTVHIYHVIAQRTIDVDILEHRHKRVDGIATSRSPIKLPEALANKEKTRLVKNQKGHMALVPVSWLASAEKRQVLEVEDVPESFASLISFSDTFQHDED
ncbi:hypothetical protein BDU57DRAFT_547894 [Ampelomyces quisqualis]|uniref:Helicase ATP-binding domain-containing protein n=1 Tax=Ampelomyces quisqualis TaxID=50730 RepID=A0A6A5QN53_AMPQU|nr:hypothetical protein BDU57DRAFT_547894 [Ampelomyces quisqualis]